MEHGKKLSGIYPLETKVFQKIADVQLVIKYEQRLYAGDLCFQKHPAFYTAIEKKKMQKAKERILAKIGALRFYIAILYSNSTLDSKDLDALTSFGNLFQILTIDDFFLFKSVMAEMNYANDTISYRIKGIKVFISKFISACQLFEKETSTFQSDNLQSGLNDILRTLKIIAKEETVKSYTMDQLKQSKLYYNLNDLEHINHIALTMSKSLLEKSHLSNAQKSLLNAALISSVILEGNGQRPIVISNLKNEHLIYRDNKFYLKALDNNDKVKRGLYRTLPISNELGTILKKFVEVYQNPEFLLSHTITKRQLSSRQISASLKFFFSSKYAASIVEDRAPPSPYTLRHLFATHLYSYWYDESSSDFSKSEFNNLNLNEALTLIAKKLNTSTIQLKKTYIGVDIVEKNHHFNLLSKRTNIHNQLPGWVINIMKAIPKQIRFGKISIPIVEFKSIMDDNLSGMKFYEFIDVCVENEILNIEDNVARFAPIGF